MALIGWWPLNGNTEDYTIKKNNLINTGGTWVNGKIGQAADFVAASTQRMTGPVNQSLYSDNSHFTLSFWVYLKSLPTLQSGLVGFNKYRSETEGGGFGVGFKTNGNLTFIVSDKVNTTETSYDAVNFPLSTWHHLTMKFDGAKIYHYLNGQLLGSVNRTSWRANHVALSLAQGTQGGWGNYCDIVLNDVRLYDHALSQKEINDLAKAKVLHYSFNKDEDIIYDGSGYKRNAILSENKPVWTNNVKNGSGGYLFDGISNKLTLNPDPLGDNLPKDFTISLWTKGFIRPSEFTYIIHRGGSSSISGSVIYIGVQNSGYFSFGVNGSWTPGSTTVMQDPNLWYHLVLRYSGTTVTGFINGQQSVSYTSNITNTVVGTYTSIGNSTIAGSNRAYNGIINDVQFYSTALSNTDILDLYQTRIKIDNQGNLYANEIVEDYEIKPGLTLRELFEDNKEILTDIFGAGNEPSQAQMDSWYKDYITSRPKSSGIIKTREFIEDYSLVNGLFFNKNWFDGTFNANELSTNYLQDGTTHTLERTSTSYVMFGDSIAADQYVENGDIIYARYDSFKETANDTFWRIWVRRNADNSDAFTLYFHSPHAIKANEEYRNESVYGRYTGTSVLTRCHFACGAGTVGATLTLKNPFLINLTKVFGAGNEPSQLQMDTWHNDHSNYTQSKTKIYKNKIDVFGSIKEG